MKYLWHLFVWHSCIVLISSSSVCEEESSVNGTWTCDKDHDAGTYNVTYGCWNGQKAEINIWSYDFPENMTTLTLQNCDALTLGLRKSDQQGQEFSQFKFLKIVNIKKCIIPPESFPHYSGYLPSNVAFENVNFEDLDLPLKCDNLETLELRNVSIKVLKTIFTTCKNLRKLTLDKVTIEFAEENAIKVKNEKGIIEIINSEIYNASQNFMDCTVAQVIFSGNLVEDFNGDHVIFSLQAEKVHLNGNRIKMLGSQTLKIVSNDITIAENIFQRAGDYIFDNISPYTFSLDSVFNFSSNEIFSLSPKALMSKGSHDVLFANLTILDNKVICNCANMLWFDSVFQDKCNAQNYFAYKWAKKNNQNKCLNIRNCGVSQVVENYHDLCESNYECPEDPNYESMCQDFKPLKSDSIPKKEPLNKFLKIMKVSSYCLFILTLLVLIWNAKKLTSCLRNNYNLKNNEKHGIKMNDYPSDPLL